MKKQATKRALLLSALSMLLCMSMLVGTTFAWFTDSVTSGRNVIQSGNLDVVLEYWDGDSYEAVETTTKLFDDQALWEPGYTEVAYLKVSNAGSLALKYQLAVNVVSETAGVNKAGESFNLSDYLVFSVVEKEITSSADLYTRETAKAAAGTTMGLKAYSSGVTALENKDDADYVALIIYMPETVGNEANHNGTNVPSIEMGVNLFATQYTYEEDSFDNTYDEDAEIPTVVSNASELATALQAGGNVQLAADVTLPADSTITVASGVETTLDLNGYTLSADNKRTATHNFMMDVKGGSLSISNGTVSMSHSGDNMGWNGATTVIDVTAGGVLNLENVTVKNEGGTDMNFAVHMNNWGEATLNANNCVFEATYCSVRVFNSGPDMNNVKITNSTLTGATRAFWVHNYASSDMGGKLYSGASAAYDEAAVLARLNLDIYGNNNTFTITGTATSPIRYGFNEGVFYDANGNIVS